MSQKADWPDALPASIRRLTAGLPCFADRTGLSGARIFSMGDRFLKIGAEPEEYRMLVWLAGKLPVPEVLAWEEADGTSYLLTRRLSGEMLCSDRFLEHPKKLVRLLAEALRMLWTVDLSGCPCLDATTARLVEAEARVADGLCRTSDAEPGTFGPGGFASPVALLEWLKVNRPPEQTVFSHGDFCLPNLFAGADGITGFLDLGRAGAAGPYQDIALCVRSLVHNFDGRFSGRPRPGFDPGLLFSELGICPDRERLRYYLLLDELL